MFPSYNQVLRLQQSALEHQAALKFPGSLCDYHYHCNPHSEISKSLPVRFLKHSAHCTDISQAGLSSSLILQTTLATSVYTCPSFNTGIMSVSSCIFIVHLMVLHGVHTPTCCLSFYIQEIQPSSGMFQKLLIWSSSLHCSQRIAFSHHSPAHSIFSHI